jgi:hypothetical protein
MSGKKGRSGMEGHTSRSLFTQSMMVPDNSKLVVSS